MTQDDYAEAWAWVHFLMESRPECLDLLRGYLADLRRDGAATPLSTRLTSMFDRPDAALMEHVRRLESGNWYDGGDQLRSEQCSAGSGDRRLSIAATFR